MRPLPFGLLLAAVLAAGPLAAQEALVPIDAAVVTFPGTTAVVRTGDFNGDSIEDGVGWYFIDNTFHSARVSLFFGNGDGTFAAGPTLTDNFINGQNSAWALEVGDFDGNGRADFAYAFDRSVAVTTSGAAGAPAIVASWTEPLAVRAMAVADFDQDGLDDVVLASSGVRLFRNTGAGFQLASTYPAGTDLRCGEFDSSRGPDIAVLSGANLTLLSGAGGALAVIQTIVHGLSTFPPLHLVPGDVDGDGDDDVALFTDGGQNVVVRCVAGGTFVKEPTAIGGPATDFADVDGDGDLDGVCCGGGGGPTPQTNDMPAVFRISINDGIGGFAKAYEMRGFGAFRLAGAVDVDGDGDRDLVAGRSVYFNRDGFVLAPQPTVVDGAINELLLPLARQAADRDRDGDPEMALANYGSLGGVFRWQNDGAGNFILKTEGLLPPAGSNYVGPWYEVDYDGDGDLDRIGNHFTGSGSFIGMLRFANAGGGEYSVAGYAAPLGSQFVFTQYFDSFARGSVAADVDEDGDQDLVAGGFLGPVNNPIWRNDGAGNFTRQGNVEGVNWPVAALDFDGDGHLDVAGAGNGFAVAFGDGNGNFGGLAAISAGLDPAADHAAIADLDSDGRLDVAVINASLIDPPLVIALQVAARTFQATALPVVSVTQWNSDARHVFADDFDGDGDSDLVVGAIDEISGVGRVLWNDGTAQFPSAIDLVLGSPRCFVDADGDSDLDLVCAENVFRSNRVPAGSAGYRRQFGASKKGLGGMAPTLGAVGPFTTGSTIEMRITGGRGGSAALFVVGLAESSQANWPAFGVTGYTFPAFLAVVLPLAGAPATPGTGELFLPIVVPPGAAGGTFFHQVFIHDVSAGPGIFSQTNGLELRYP